MSVAFAVLTRVPLVPWTVSVNVPRAEFLVASVSFEVPEVVSVIGENDAVAPVGTPLTANVTVPVNPFCGVTETLKETLPPFETVLDEGDIESAKVGGGK